MIYLSEWNKVWTAVATDGRFSKSFPEHVGDEWRMLNYPPSGDLTHLKEQCKRKIHFLTTFKDDNGITLVYNKGGEPVIVDEALKSRLSNLQLMSRLGRDDKISMRRAQELDRSTNGKGYRS